MTAPTIKAIETRYAGCRFRSRLEARWAVLFDSLGYEWRYEPQGFDLGSGVWYLPDFYLPRIDRWLEIKGGFRPYGLGTEGLVGLDEKDRVKLRRFTQRLDTFMLIGGDIPRPRPGSPLFGMYTLEPCDKNSDDNECHFPHVRALGYTEFSIVMTSGLSLNGEYDRALTAARSARFDGKD